MKKFILLLILLNTQILFSQQIKLPDLSELDNKPQQQQIQGTEIQTETQNKNQLQNINPPPTFITPQDNTKTNIVTPRSSIPNYNNFNNIIDSVKGGNISSQNNNFESISRFPAAIEYYGQVIPITIPFGMPILIEMPDYIMDKTVENAITGLQILPAGREETSILRILLTKNIDLKTVLHVTLANGLVVSFDLKLLKNNGDLDPKMFVTRYKIIDYVSKALSDKEENTKILDSPEIVNFVADRMAYRELLSLASIYDFYKVKNEKIKIAEDNERSINITRYVTTSTNLVFRTNFRGRDRQIPVILIGLKTYYCNKNKFDYLTLDVDYLKQIFPSYYKISYKRETDSIIPPDACVPVYVILWEGLK